MVWERDDATISMVGMLVPLKGGIGSIYITPQKAIYTWYINVYKWYILPIG